MSGKRHTLDVDDLVSRYLAGEAENTIALDLGVGRPTIRRRLLEAGIQPRNRAEAMSVRMANTGADERKRLAAAANAARRGSKASMVELERKAVTAERTLQKVRNGEIGLASLLSTRGMRPDLQKACGPYNIDIGLAPVAVEVHMATAHPMRSARQRERVVYLADHGWCTLYVWLVPRTEATDSAADEIVAHVERARADPSAVREYRVIRGGGQDAP